MKKFKKKKIYLDYAGATPIDKEVLKLVFKYQNIFANPGAIHQAGLLSKKILNIARTRIAKLLNAHADEIIFTGSGTESNALAILGVVFQRKVKSIPHIVTTNIEHSAVLENCRYLEKIKKAEVTYIPVKQNGIVDPKEIKEALKKNTILVSVMYANNEIGTVQPIREIAKEIRYFKKNKNQNLLFHTDACQAMNYLETENIEKLGVDLLSFNSSKIYGPKGVGVLYKKREVKISPIYRGGGQESGLRSGTENVASIMGASLALEKVCRIKQKENIRLKKIRDHGIKKLLSLSGLFGYEIILNGDEINRLVNNINISVSSFSSELLVIELDALGIQVSEKSACHSREGSISHAIKAIGNKGGSLRISLGQMTKKADINTLVLALKRILKKYSKWK